MGCKVNLVVIPIQINTCRCQDYNHSLSVPVIVKVTILKAVPLHTFTYYFTQGRAIKCVGYD
jgi:hypothetical protein